MSFVAVKCPQCGADIQLDDSREFGFCSFCGAKVMQEKIVIEHKGNVKINKEDELSNLYIAARNATQAGDDTSALSYYRQIATIEPNSWEALLYTVILGLSNIRNGEIESAAAKITNCLPKVFQLISTNITNEQEKKDAIRNVIDVCTEKVTWLITAAKNFRKLRNGSDMSTPLLIYGEPYTSILKDCGDIIKATFNMSDNDYKELVVMCWKNYYTFSVIHNGYGNGFKHKTSIMINELDPSFKIIEKDETTKQMDIEREYKAEVKKIKAQKISFFKKQKAIWEIAKRNKKTKYSFLYPYFCSFLIVVISLGAVLFVTLS